MTDTVEHLQGTVISFTKLYSVKVELILGDRFLVEVLLNDGSCVFNRNLRMGLRYKLA